MKMKKLLRYTSTIILRTALLLGAMALLNIPQVTAQTAAQWAELPDAFETVDPTTVDWSQQPYFYIQFFEGNVHSFLGEYGTDMVMRAKDYVPFSKSIQWTLEPTGTAGEYYLKSLNGNYIRQWSSNVNYCGATPTIDDGRYKFTLRALSDGYYELDRGDYCLGREDGKEWGRIRVGFGFGSPRARLRFAKLKSNIAHIIYYREEGIYDYLENNLHEPSNETRHYLTYSGTDSSLDGTPYWWSSDVSSRKSVIPKDKSLWTLPTAAAYHLDGLWTLQKADERGNFYIKRYGTSQYLNENEHDNTGLYDCALGVKDATKGTYKLESSDANRRYSRIQNVKFSTELIGSIEFFTWDDYKAGSNSIDEFSAGNHVGDGSTINAGDLIIGDGSVSEYIYADLTDYSKMIINGDADMQLRILLSRQGYEGRPWVEKDVTIGRDGKAVVDLTDMTSKFDQATVKMTYIDYNNPETPIGQVATTLCGWNKFSMDGTVNVQQNTTRKYIGYLQVDASAIPGTIKRVTLSGDFEQLSARGLEYGVGYNNSTWSSELTWNTADRHVTALGATQTVGRSSADRVTPLSFDITDAFTDSKVKTIMVYCFNLGGSITNPRVEVEYVPNTIDLSVDYVHLNAIKAGWNSPSGTINNITLEKEENAQGARYLHHAHGDGWQVLQWSGDDPDYWHAGFLPVEVPESKKDDYYGVVLGVKRERRTDSRIKLTRETDSQGTVTVEPLDGSTTTDLYGAKFTVTSSGPTNVFQIKNLVKGCYTGIVIRFGEDTPTGYYVHTYGDTYNFTALPSGIREYTIDLSSGGPMIDDFTIFTMGQPSGPITISSCEFTPTGSEPDCGINEMLNYDGKTSPYSEAPGERIFWQLEQVDDYAHFRLKALNGQYFQDFGTMTRYASDAMIFTNTSLLETFDLKWFYLDIKKETPVDQMVTHRISYLKQYADQYAELELDKQGLATEVQSDWWNYDSKTQKVNHFEITHYVKQGNTITVEFPTILNNSSDHIYFQRWYHYNDETCDNDTYPDGTDIDGLKSHVSLDVSDNVQYFLYQNGIVTGEKLDWSGIDQGGHVRHANRNFKFTNSDGKNFTVAADVSRYSDLTYKTTGDLEEPSLTMRYIYYMKDAKDMAKKLTAKTFKGFEFIDSKEGENFLEAKTFHFPAKQIHYENLKKAGYRGEFIGLRHLFSDYWVFSDGNASSTDDNNLLSAVNSDNLSGKIEVKIYDPNETKIRLGGYNPNLNAQQLCEFNDGADGDYQGFYYYDMMDININRDVTPTRYTQSKMSYGDSRFIVFRYPSSGKIDDEKVNKPVYINVYFKNGETRYQLAQYTIIFDEGTVTLPYTSVNGSNYVKADNDNTGSYTYVGTTKYYKDRDPKNLINKAGKPIAKITFDYPSGDTYHFPSKGETRHNQQPESANGTIDHSSPVPLTFDNTNYAFDGDGCNWGSYAMVSEMSTANGNNIPAVPADDIIHGYGPTDTEIENNPQLQSLRSDAGLQNGFLYIDASEQPGDICSAPFLGDFCANDKLMFSGWISGSNKAGADYNRCPGGVTLTVKGERNKHDENGRIVYNEDGSPKKETVTLYRFCPGQIYELDNGTGADGSSGATRVVWQQFYFEFIVTDKYDRHWVEVNNNCVSSRGGDFMLDNIEVYAVVPEVIPGVNTPLCISVDDNGEEVTDMRLLKLSVNYNKLKTSGNVNESSTGSSELGFVVLDKKMFLETFRTELQKLTDAEKDILHLSAFDFQTISLEKLADAIEDGELSEIKEVEAVQEVQEGDPGYEEFQKYLAHYKAFEEGYHNAFDAAILGEKKTWHSNNPTVNNKNASVMYFEWKHQFNDMETYSFAKAVNKTDPVYGETTTDGEKYVVMNGNFPELSWKTNTDYYIITTSQTFVSMRPFTVFNLCSECNNASEFRIDPPYDILGLEKSEETNDYIVCEGQIPTMLLDLKGYDFNGNEVSMKDINYDWWLGDAAYTEPDPDDANNVIYPKLATLENYHAQSKTVDGTTIRLDKALSTLRIYYPDVTDLNGVIPQIAEGDDPKLTQAMIDYLQEVVDVGQLVLHQKSVSVPAEPASKDDPYFYLVACPIHDDSFVRALNPKSNEYVAYYCDEPQGLRIKVGEKAPTLRTGFVPGEHGFTTYDYSFPNGTDPVLSIRLAKKYQFETVKNTEVEAEGGVLSYDVNHLWLPIRNAETQTASGVIQKSNDDNIYLASSNDPIWDKKIYQSMKKNGLLPVVGRIVTLEAINTSGQTEEALKNNQTLQADNRLRVYFTKNFEVREGYNYTLSLPFQENDNKNACDGTILINLKIVPDYEVWTGAAGHTDWNNDENWRRADGNTTFSNWNAEENTDDEKLNSDELYRANGAKTNPNSPLNEYMTNFDNYRTPKDRVFRKGFAPLYCTHVLMKNDEWGNAPVLYDPLDYNKNDLEHKFTNYPFPNLRETSTPILKFDMQARRYDMWYETYGVDPDRGDSDRPNDLIAEMYKVNSCDEIAFQSGTELLNAHLLNYNSAWMEYQLDNKRWYLLGSPLQGTISGEWYAPTGKAKQKTTYYDPVKFSEFVKVSLKSTDNPSALGYYKKSGQAYEVATETAPVANTDYYIGYDRYSPAIYQRSWDKAKAVLYEIGSTYDKDDDKQDANLGTENEGIWSSGNTYWPVENGGTADEYLDRLGYKPFGQNKANVAIKGIWSNTYNDAQVDYAMGGFSVMVMNHLKGNDQSGEVVDQSANEKRYSSIVRLPKEDTMYDYYKFEENGGNDGGTDTYLIKPDNYPSVPSVQIDKGRALNRGRLKTDLLLPEMKNNEEKLIIQKTEKEASIYGDKRTYTRIPIKEDSLQVMNATFYQQGDNAPTAGFFEEIVPAGISDLGFYLVENPFPCGLDMEKFFTANEDVLEAKYWLVTENGQHLVQKADEAGEWITTDQEPVEYLNPNYVAPFSDDPVSDDPAPTEPKTLIFYPNAVVAPGQGFFVQAKTPATSSDTPVESITVKFSNEMQTRSRFGEIDGKGREFKVVVGQTQRMEEVVIDIDIDGDGILGETYEEEVDGETVEIVEKETVLVPLYKKEGDEYVLDDDGNKIPVLDPITEDVVLYKYKQATLAIPDDESTEDVDESGTIDKEYPLRARTRGSEATNLPGLVITAKRSGLQSSALVMQREGASNDFLPSEDTETFVTSDFESVPTVYTLCGRLATTINSIHDFSFLPVGVESNSDVPCTLTFKGVEMLGDSIAFYDAVERKLTPLESGMTFEVSGQTQNRYYLVRSLIQEEAAAETHLQIFTEGLTAKVIASTAEPITNVRCYDTAGRLIHSASPQTSAYSFSLPRAGIYIIDAETENDHKTKKVMTK